MHKNTSEAIERFCDLLDSIRGFDRESIGELADWLNQRRDFGLCTDRREMAAVAKAAALVLEDMIAEGGSDRHGGSGARGATSGWLYETGHGLAAEKRILSGLITRTIQNTGSFSVGDML